MSKFTVFNAGGYIETASKPTKQRIEPLYPPDVEDDQPQDNALYPMEVQQNESKAKELKQNLPKWKKLCQKVDKIDTIENGANHGKNDVDPLLPNMFNE